MKQAIGNKFLNGKQIIRQKVRLEINFKGCVFHPLQPWSKSNKLLAKCLFGSTKRQVSLESQKCKGNDALDTCEHTRVFKINNNCKLLKGEPWKAFALAANPPLRCPLKKMTHSIRNVTVGVPDFLLLPLGSGYYKTKVIFRDQTTDEFVMCAYAESQLYSYSTD